MRELATPTRRLWLGKLRFWFARESRKVAQTEKEVVDATDKAAAKMDRWKKRVALWMLPFTLLVPPHHRGVQVLREFAVHDALSPAMVTASRIPIFGSAVASAFGARSYAEDGLHWMGDLLFHTDPRIAELAAVRGQVEAAEQSIAAFDAAARTARKAGSLSAGAYAQRMLSPERAGLVARLNAAEREQADLVQALTKAIGPDDPAHLEAQRP